MFDKVDRIFGEPGAKYDYNALEGGTGGDFGGGGGAPLGGGSFGDELGDLGAPGSEDMGDLGGSEETMDLGGAEEGAGNLMESTKKNDGKKTIINERLNKMIDSYMDKILHKDSEATVIPGSSNDNFIVNEGFNVMMKELKEISEKKSELDNLLD